MGLAFGAFHRYIYGPLKAGTLEHPLLHKLTFVKAAAAGAFVYHELSLAITDAQADHTLSKLVSPITALESKLHTVASDLKGGHSGQADINQANGMAGSLSGLASSAGQPISDIVPATP
jgi:hypothetical protein